MKRPDRRGALLLLIGVIYFLIGSSYVVLDIEPRTLEPYSFADGLFGVLTIKVWGVIWAACGLLGGVAGLTHRFTWDRRGFVVLTGFSLLWGALCAMSALIDGHERGIIVALIWWAFAGVLMITSGMD